MNVIIATLCDLYISALFQMNAKGQMIAQTPTAFKEIESEVVEETGLQCCICLEGYRNQPQKVFITNYLTE